MFLPSILFSRFSYTERFEEQFKALGPKDQERVKAFLKDALSVPLDESKAQIERSLDAQKKVIFFAIMPDDPCYMVSFRQEQVLGEYGQIVDVAIFRSLQLIPDE